MGTSALLKFKETFGKLINSLQYILKPSRYKPMTNKGTTQVRIPSRKS